MENKLFPFSLKQFGDIWRLIMLSLPLTQTVQLKLFQLYRLPKPLFHPSPLDSPQQWGMLHNTSNRRRNFNETKKHLLCTMCSHTLAHHCRLSLHDATLVISVQLLT